MRTKLVTVPPKLAREIQGQCDDDMATLRDLLSEVCVLDCANLSSFPALEGCRDNSEVVELILGLARWTIKRETLAGQQLAQPNDPAVTGKRTREAA